MVNLLPAVLIGGPPHAGKSVLFYSLTQALREHNIRHHAIRACPDGEGNWSQESNQQLVGDIRKSGKWSESFITRLSEDLEHRCLPLLVDVGGAPKSSEACLFNLCTHAILLLKPDQSDNIQPWDHIVKEHNLQLLARVNSQLNGISAITAQSPFIEGTITGLVRGKEVKAKGPVFDALVASIATLFNSYSPHELEQIIFEQAPSELLNLYDIIPANERWEPAMLLPFLASLPAQTPLSVYGIGPNWLYAALSAYEDQQPFYLFDPKLPFGWIQPARVYLDMMQSPEIHIEQSMSNQAFTLLKITFPNDRIAYFQPDPLAFPPLSREQGVIIDGRVPYWLLTALVRLYKDAGVTWIATYYPQREKAVVVYSRVPTHILGDLVPMPA